MLDAKSPTMTSGGGSSASVSPGGPKSASGALAVTAAPAKAKGSGQPAEMTAAEAELVTGWRQKGSVNQVAPQTSATESRWGPKASGGLSAATSPLQGTVNVAIGGASPPKPWSLPQ